MKGTAQQEEILKIMESHGGPITKLETFVILPYQKNYHYTEFTIEFQKMVELDLIERGTKTGFYQLPAKGADKNQGIFNFEN